MSGARPIAAGAETALHHVAKLVADAQRTQDIGDEKRDRLNRESAGRDAVEGPWPHTVAVLMDG
ncbi:hypothetical protein [Rhizobium leguminosarum]|uniref:hypothetical protein n=1 Tax=Rhizobium leguminosarum TaxID=384 RepID=UPI001C94F1BD|nr:hypothetical protein [Rhizobium leguminosarum]MBY5695653.1 hypothetical protein [Rhizobium leguminosarum]